MQSFYGELETVVESDSKMRDKGKVTKFRRTNKQSEEVARKFMIMRRLQLKLENMATNRQAVGNVFQDTCTNLTLTFRAARSSCHLLPCDPITPYRSIDGCCNNFLEPALGKKLGKKSFSKILSIRNAQLPLPQTAAPCLL